MLPKFCNRFSTKLILLITLVFLIPVATSLVMLVVTSNESLKKFDSVIVGSEEGKKLLIQEIFSQSAPQEIKDPDSIMKLLRDYEKRRTFGLFMSLIVISVALSGVVILLSMLILKKGMISLNELSIAASRVGEGGFDVSIKPRSKDEFAQLVGAFKFMVQRLNETMVSKDRAEEASRLKSEFLSNMSHEIRTPLNGIMGLAELLEEEEEDKEKKDNLDTIRKCGENLLHLINEILELSKLEAGKMILHPNLTVTADVIKEAVAAIEVGCRKKNIELHVNVSPDVPAMMDVDRHKLVQIIVNLLGNAFKFTEKGFINLRVNVYSGERMGNIIFIVEDSGTGISRENQKMIFESFTRGDSHLTRSSDGTGLGLAIAKKLVTLMGGDIWLESEKGRGSVFSFTIKI